MDKIKQIWETKSLRNKIIFSVVAIILYRMLAQISIPGVNLQALQAIFDQNQLLSTLSLLTGGSAENFSIVLMGLGPYINASIIIQLLTVVVPKLEEISKEGEQGQRKINSLTRWVALPLAFLQSYGTILLLNSQTQIPIIDNIQDPTVILPIMLTVTTGTILLMWMGELITEQGIGNGISLLIFAGIIAGVPTAIAQNAIIASQDSSQLIQVVGIVLLTLGLIVATVLVTEGYREIPVSYASRSAKGQMSKLPIRINQAGMIPIIFAVSILSFPNLIAQLTSNSTVGWVKAMSDFILRHLNFHGPLYIALFFTLIILFTFFYVSVTFKPDQIAENIQKRGGYIPGIRPGSETVKYLSAISNRLNLFGGAFIGLVAILPMLLQLIFGGSTQSIPLLISGAGILIIVGVIIDLIRQVNAQLVMHNYEKLY